MRLSRPIYESMPLIYATIGGLAIFLAYLDREDEWSGMMLVIGLTAEVAALTVFLRRQDYRALRQEYSGDTSDFLPNDLLPR